MGVWRAIAAFVAIVSVSIGAACYLATPLPPKGEVPAYLMRVEIAGGHGSGVVIGKGLVLTARHVAEYVGDKVLRDVGGNEYKATVLWMGTEENDLALLSFKPLDPVPLPSVSLNCDKPLKPGDVVTAWGYPISMGAIITQGYFAGTWDAYQVSDLTIGPGNSGGPLLDKDGRLVGINVAIPSIPLGWFGTGLLPYTLSVSQEAVCKSLNINLN